MTDQPDIVTDYAKAQYDRRYGGAILIDGVEVAITLQCVHCGGHWVKVSGSGKTRGWCMRCNGPVCGTGCAECVPHERQLEIMEGTFLPGTATIYVGVDVPRE